MTDPFAAFKQYPQWIICKHEPKPNGKTNKFPFNPYTHQVANAHDPTLWMSYDAASFLVSQSPDWHLGFVFTENDPFFFLDIDNALATNGQWSDLSGRLCGLFAGAAVEISQSGTGLHIFGTYSGAAPSHKSKNTSLDIELYTSGRFVSLTQSSAMGDAGSDHTETLRAVIDEYFRPMNDAAVTDWRDTPADGYTGPSDDDELIAKMLASKTTKEQMGFQASFEQLWTNDQSAIDKYFGGDRSSVDIALANKLAFWTGCNHARMWNLMWRSGLVRDKWYQHKTYVANTILHAAADCPMIYTYARPETRQSAEVQTTQQFMGPESMPDYFAGCVYVQDRHAAFTPGGMLLKPEQFRATYGGYEFSRNIENTSTTRNAWEAFTENQAVRFPKVATTCFRPEEPSGAIIDEEGYRMVNVYVPIDTPRVQASVAPFLDLMARLLPDRRDREILLSYMASLVQNPGVKFQWCPLIQGAEGNGKSVLLRALAFSVGHRYSHFPNATELGGGGQKFNAWIQHKLFIGVEEIYVSDRREVTDALKPLITNDRIEIQGKGRDQTVGDNRANFLMATNHKDAVHITVDGRRYAIFYTAQQSAEDMKRDGMLGSYFPDLYRWLRDVGYAAINGYLRQYAVSAEFDPAGACQRAPNTSSTAEAVSLSFGAVEQEIIEAVEEGRPGFSGGWISSYKLTELLKSVGAERRVPLNRRREMLRRLGYEYHPGLPDGRVAMPIAEEGMTRPRLFLRQNHPSSNLTENSVITKFYKKAQNYVINEINAANSRTTPERSGVEKPIYRQ